MIPYYQDAAVTLYHGDCREILPQLRCPNTTYCLEACDGRCEPWALVTDPPYGHGDKWQGGTWGAAEMYRVDAQRWDAVPFPADDLLPMVKEASASVIWGGNYYPLPPSRCWLAWRKSSPMPTLADFELAWTSFDRPSKLWDEDRNPDGRRLHPTQKPLLLMSWCLSFVQGTILDPFAGSGTTLRAAKDLNRRAIGIEIEEKYCYIAAKRLEQETLQFEEKQVQSQHEVARRQIPLLGEGSED